MRRIVVKEVESNNKNIEHGRSIRVFLDTHASAARASRLGVTIAERAKITTIFWW